MPHPTSAPRTDDLRIDVRPTPDGARIEMPFDKNLVRSLKRLFPHARWTPELRGCWVWRVTGERAQAQAECWAEERHAEARAARQAQEHARRAAINAQRAALRDNPIDSHLVRLSRDKLHVDCAHSEVAAFLVRGILGAARVPNTDTWTIPLLGADRLRAVLPEIEAGYAKAVSFRAACTNRDANAPGALRVMQSPIVTVLHDHVAVRFEFSLAADALIKGVPGARWRSASNCWVAPLAEWEHLLAVLPRIEAAHESVSRTLREARAAAAVLTTPVGTGYLRRNQPPARPEGR